MALTILQQWKKTKETKAEKLGDKDKIIDVSIDLHIEKHRLNKEHERA